MHEIILRELRVYQPLNIPDVNSVLSGRVNVLEGYALAVITASARSVKTGLDAWGDNYLEERKRQEQKLKILESAVNK
jgi:hypothetical protein